jgi:integrase/recombinase XerD
LVLFFKKEPLPSRLAFLHESKSTTIGITPNFAGRRVVDIDNRMIAEYVNARVGTVKNATVQRDLTALSSLLPACNAWGGLDGTNPAKSFDRTIIRAPRLDINPPTEAEVAVMLSYAPPGMASVLRFLAATGCRAQEAAQLERRSIDWQAGTVTLCKTKTCARTIRFATPGGDCTSVLADTVPSLASGFVFRSREYSSYRRLSTGFWQVRERAEATELGAGRTFRPFRVPDRRHAFALRWLRAGGSIFDLSKHLGHTSVLTTEGYASLLTSDERATIRIEGRKVATLMDTAAKWAQRIRIHSGLVNA